MPSSYNIPQPSVPQPSDAGSSQSLDTVMNCLKSLHQRQLVQCELADIALMQALELQLDTHIERFNVPVQLYGLQMAVYARSFLQRAVQRPLAAASRNFRNGPYTVTAIHDVNSSETVLLPSIHVPGRGRAWPREWLGVTIVTADIEKRYEPNAVLGSVQLPDAALPRAFNVKIYDRRRS